MIDLSRQENNMAEPKKIARRSFFAGLGLVAAAGVAVKMSAAPTPAPLPDEPAGTGYRLTEHVKKYYRTTTL
jgi:hypothetical protein